MQDLISHNANSDHEQLLQSLRQNVPSCGLELAEQICTDLSHFNLGKFLIKNRGLDGQWTSYILMHPDNDSNSKLNDAGEQFTELEKWLLEECPVFKATQERFRIFRETTQQLLRNGMNLASVPCGLMDDLLTLNFDKVNNVSLFGIDLDANSIDIAKINSNKITSNVHISFAQSDAWQLPYEATLDLITSNGLNIYVASDEKVIELYRGFHKCLKSGGHLLTSFLTPELDSNSAPIWNIKTQSDLAKQRLLFSEILQIKWQCFRSEVQTREQLEEAGFTILKVHYDEQRMFPTVLAQKH